MSDGSLPDLEDGFAVRLSVDHRPDNAAEKRRVIVLKHSESNAFFQRM